MQAGWDWPSDEPLPDYASNNIKSPATSNQVLLYISSLPSEKWVLDSKAFHIVLLGGEQKTSCNPYIYISHYYTTARTIRAIIPSAVQKIATFHLGQLMRVRSGFEPRRALLFLGDRSYKNGENKRRNRAIAFFSGRYSATFVLLSTVLR